MRKINQTYEYCDKQIAWLEEKFKDVSLKSLCKEELENEFYEIFGIRRSFNSLVAKAKRLGMRPIRKKLIAGKSIKKGKKGDCDQILYQVNPPRFKSLARYTYEQYYGVELSSNDVIYLKDGNTKNLAIDNLVKMTRQELIIFNGISDPVPFETRKLLSELILKNGNLKGEGTWSKEELEWLKNLDISKRKRGFWKDVAKRLNRKFGKNRSNHSVLMRYYSMKGRSTADSNELKEV